MLFYEFKPWYIYLNLCTFEIKNKFMDVIFFLSCGYSNKTNIFAKQKHVYFYIAALSFRVDEINFCPWGFSIPIGKPIDGLKTISKKKRVDRKPKRSVQ